MEKSGTIKAGLIALSVVAASYILGNAFQRRNNFQDAISVVGLGAKNFSSDEIFFSGSYGARAQTAKAAFDIINADKEKVKHFFLSKGFKTEELNFGAVSFEKSFKTIETERNGETIKTEQIFDAYIAKQSISIKSKKNPELMKRIEQVADQTSELINSGIEFSPNAIQYTYSDLPSLKHDLIQKASQDAKERAEKIAKTANGKLGKLKTASMGVFQITGEGSNEEDSYGGNNDIYNKQKSARITVRLEYELE